MSFIIINLIIIFHRRRGCRTSFRPADQTAAMDNIRWSDTEQIRPEPGPRHLWQLVTELEGRPVHFPRQPEPAVELRYGVVFVWISNWCSLPFLGSQLSKGRSMWFLNKFFDGNASCFLALNQVYYLFNIAFNIAFIFVIYSCNLFCIRFFHSRQIIYS